MFLMLEKQIQLESLIWTLIMQIPSYWVVVALMEGPYKSQG